MSLDVGSVHASLGATLDDSGFDRYDRRLRDAREAGAKGAIAKLDSHADTRGFDRYDQAVKRSHKSNEDFIRGGARVRTGMSSLFIGGAGGAAAITGFYALKSAVTGAFGAYKESERVGKQTNAVLKSTGGVAGVSAKQVNDLANALSAKTGIDDEAIQSGENLLLTFTNIRNETGKGNDIFNQATATITDMSAALGQDMSSSAIQLGKALNDPIKGVTALQRVGVSFTAQQKDQIKELVKSGHTLDAQKLILRELNKEFGGSAAATATNSMRMKVAFGNLAEATGRLLSPAMEKVSGVLAKFVNGMVDGTGAGGRFVAILKGVGQTAIDYYNRVAKFAGTVKGLFDSAGTSSSSGAKSIRSAIAGIGPTWDAFKVQASRAFAGVRQALAPMVPDLKIIANVLITVFGRAAEFALAVFRRALPGIATLFKGVAQVIRGVVEVIAGLLTLDMGKVADGFKHIFGGLITFIRGFVRTATASFRELVSRLGPVALDAGKAALNGVVHGIAGLPGALASLARRAVSAFVSGLAGLAGALPHALAGAVKGGAGLAANFGKQVKDWVNAHTLFGDQVSVGKGPIHISFRIPALAMGGRVGPTAGGARAFIAGEGARDEWVISQEGPRGANIGYAVEALEHLTGRNVAMYAKGKRAKKPAKPKPVFNTTNTKLRVGAADRGLGNYDRDLGLLNREYGQLDRLNSLSVEDFVVEQADGTSVVDQGAISKRSKEISGQVGFLRDKIRKKLQDYRNQVRAAIKVYDTALRRLAKAIKRAKGARRSSERKGYQTLHASYLARRGELRDKFSDLGLDLEDNRLDILELEGERADVKGTQAPTTAPLSDSGSSDPGSSSSDASPAAAAPAPPTAEDIAAGVAAALASFNAGQADVYSSFGANFISAGRFGALAAGAPASAGELGAGGRYFGGGTGGTEGGVAAAAGGVVQHIYFNGPQPADPHTFTQATLFELQAAI